MLQQKKKVSHFILHSIYKSRQYEKIWFFKLPGKVFNVTHLLFTLDVRDQVQVGNKFTTILHQGVKSQVES